jgi:organic hydroperoxide reductase OsmC/OhrA
MKPLPHLYEVQLTSGATGYATASAAGLPDLRSAPPADFDGPGDAWSPEDLLVASLGTCFAFTLRAIARASKVEFVSLKTSAAGTLDRKEGVIRFTEILIRAALTIPAGGDKERALALMEKAEKLCLVTASLAVPVRLEAQVSVA